MITKWINKCVSYQDCINKLESDNTINKLTLIILIIWYQLSDSACNLLSKLNNAIN